MKLYELYDLHDMILLEAAARRASGPLSTVMMGIMAASLLANAFYKSQKDPTLVAKAQQAAQIVQHMTSDQYDNLIVKLKELEPTVGDQFKQRTGKEFAPVVQHIEKITPQTLAKELTPTDNTVQKHTVDNKEIGIRASELKRAEYAINFFEEKGMNRPAAIALVGGFMQESRLDPTAVNPDSGAYGIAQWIGDRKTNKIPDDFEGQLEHVWHELQTNERGTYAMLQRADTMGRLLYAAARFERFKGWKQRGEEWGDRTEFTKLLMSKFGHEKSQQMLAMK